MADGAKDPPLGEAGAVELLRRTWPWLRWRSLRYIDDGWDHEVLVLDDRLVVRIPNEDPYRRMLATERVLLDRLSGAVRAALPVVRWTAGERISVHRYVNGAHLTPERFGALPDRDRDEIADQLAEVLTAIHELAPADLLETAPWTVEEEHAEVVQLAANGLPGLLTSAELAAVEGILADVPALLAAAPAPVLLHGDVYEDHLLWDAGARRLGLIDFSDLSTGDPAIDFAELVDYGLPFLEDVARRSGGDAALVDRAVRYGRWLAVYLMTDHLLLHKTPFAVARIPFDRRVVVPSG
ncbi:phosphotransferase [Amnibacterium sp.]|uniref:phosphotransferase n=1 Tax=Amnibacterium sp. TaxID=1872496 RepID=UPI00261C264E|nr:phosphotransferase [Amnibacterium sp.]MCU1473891.1 aminoglycoside phosphotransferase family protein [Amnibacterium sp.]